MGCFSFICKKCRRAVISDSLRGENVRLSLLKDGQVIEEMQGQYDSYGAVFDENHRAFEWKSMPWDSVVDLMFHPKKNNGIAATHVECKPDEFPETRSADDPGQGWGRLKSEHRGECEIFHKLYENGKQKL
jgi:hypothetical protein